MNAPVAGAILQPASSGSLSPLNRARQIVQRRAGAVLQAKKRGFRLRGARLAFLSVVIVPTILAVAYLFLLASDQFISEAKFVVRSPQKPAMTGLSAFLQSSGLGTAHDDSFVVIDYLKSRDALAEIEPLVHFRDLVSRSDADFIARFPAFYSNDSFEALYDHYLSIVSVINDSSTSISTLKVRLLAPEDAQKVARALLDASERLINRLNERSLGDSVGLATGEVKKAEQRSIAAQNALTAYRVQVGLVDNLSTAKGALEVIGGLDKELALSRTQLIQTQTASPNSPGLQSLRDRVSALEQQIASQRGKLVGRDGSLVGTFAEFERLTLEAEFAAKALLLSNTILESARVEAMRKQLYLERVVEPHLPDYSRYPRRILVSLTVFGSCMMAFGMLWLLVVNAKEHAT